MFVFGTADDVFAMAVRIEENGNAFYEGAAEKTDDPQAKKLFQDLALMEAGHIQAFKALRSQLPSSSEAKVWDPEGLAESYLQAAADTHIFTVEAATPRLAAAKTPLEALDMALQFEKDSMAFFLGMKEILPDESGKSELDKLIMQEMDHYRMLTAVKRKLESGETATIV
jgi:rubrerythrin